MQIHRAVLRTAVALGLLLPSAAFAQHQSLSPAELQGAREAMKSILGNEPAPTELIWSNKVAYPDGRQAGNATFAAPFTAVSDLLKVRKAISCDLSQLEWRCRRESHYQIEVEGKERSFAAREGVDERAVANVVNHLFSMCFTAQVRELKGAHNRIRYLLNLEGISRHERGFEVNSIGREDYIFERSDADPRCRFEVSPVREQPVAQRSESHGELLLGLLFWVICGLCLLTCVYPWNFKSPRSRILVHLPLLLLVLVPLYLAAEPTPGAGAMIRIDLVVLVPLVGLATIGYLVKLVLALSVIKIRRRDDEA